jgi:IS5 family transposase
LNDIIDWQRFTKKLIKYYRGQGTFGRPPFNPAMMLRMLFGSYLYNLSERQTEVYVNESLPAKYFVGLAVDQKAPDHSSMTKFRERLLKNEKLTIFEDLLAEIVQIVLESGVKFRSIQIMDSVHSVANINNGKDEQKASRPSRQRRNQAHS